MLARGSLAAFRFEQLTNASDSRSLVKHTSYLAGLLASRLRWRGYLGVNMIALGGQPSQLLQ
jgi:hypothetical protein